MLGKSSFLSAAAAMLGFSATTAEGIEAVNALGHAMRIRQGSYGRNRTRGQHRPAGTKLLRKAAKGRLGMATLR